MPSGTVSVAPLAIVTNEPESIWYSTWSTPLVASLPVIEESAEVARVHGLVEGTGWAAYGRTEANLSLLKSSKVKGVRFETLDKICAALECQPGDLLEYKA